MNPVGKTRRARIVGLSRVETIMRLRQQSHPGLKFKQGRYRSDRRGSAPPLETTQTIAGVFRSQLEVFSRGLLDRFPERQLS
jgi:hypothetical protein